MVKAKSVAEINASLKPKVVQSTIEPQKESKPPKEPIKPPRENKEVKALTTRISELEAKIKELEGKSFTDNFWLVWEDFSQSVDSAFRKWKAKTVEWSVIKTEILKCKK